MNRLGPLVDRLTATADDNGRVTLFGRPPGPAGLTTVRLAAGRVDLAVDVAEPANLVSLTYTDPLDGPTARVLEVLLDRSVLQTLERVDKTRPDETLVWQTDDDSPDRTANAPRPNVRRLGELGRIGQLALVTGELTRIERSPFGTALGLFELADMASVVEKDFLPIPDHRALMAAALGHLRHSDPGTWTNAIADGDFDRLEELLGRWSRNLGLRSPDAREPLNEILARLRRRPDRDVQSGLAAASPPMVADLATASAIRATGPGGTTASGSSAISAGAAEPPVPLIDVVVDPWLTSVTVSTAVFRDDHLYVEGRGTTDVDAWVRVFERGPAPTLIAMAPVRPTAIGRWSARALLPSGTTAAEALVDLTTRPKDPWQSPPTRAVTAAVHLGALAARSTRRGQQDAPREWERAADAWAAAGDDVRADQARRLGRESRGQMHPGYRSRAGLDDGPFAVDLVD